MKTHHLKTDPAEFNAVAACLKTFELRRDDRGFEQGDLLRLRQTVFSHSEMENGHPLVYTGETLIRWVSHILRGPAFGLEEGWCIMSILPLNRILDPGVMIARQRPICPPKAGAEPSPGVDLAHLIAESEELTAIYQYLHHGHTRIITRGAVLREVKDRLSEARKLSMKALGYRHDYERDVEDAEEEFNRHPSGRNSQELFEAKAALQRHFPYPSDDPRSEDYCPDVNWFGMSSWQEEAPPVDDQPSDE